MRPMALIGYARVSTEEQHTDPQLLELHAAGVDVVFEDRASGASRVRPQLTKALARVDAGDTLVVVRIDRLARGLSHLLQLIEGLRGRGAYFRSLRDPIDTSSPQGLFTLQVLGAAAELERALIRERTKAGLRAAKVRGRVGGNPGLRRRDPDALARVAEARAEGYMSKLQRTEEEWLAVVRAHRPALAWPQAVQAVNAGLPAGRKPWTMERLIRATRHYVKAGLADATLLQPAPPPSRERKHLHDVVALLARGSPKPSLRRIARELDQMRMVPPRGGATWSASSVRLVIGRLKSIERTRCDQPRVPASSA